MLKQTPNSPPDLVPIMDSKDKQDLASIFSSQIVFHKWNTKCMTKDVTTYSHYVQLFIQTPNRVREKVKSM